MLYDGGFWARRMRWNQKKRYEAVTVKVERKMRSMDGGVRKGTFAMPW